MVLGLLGLVGGFAVVGGSLKLLDDVFDEGRFSFRLVPLFTFISAGLMAYLSAVDAVAGALLAAIVLGTAVAEKLDHPAFKLTGLSCLAGLLYGHYMVAPVNVGLLGVLALAALADEILDDFGHIRDEPALRTRPVLKIAALGAAITGVFNPSYFLALLAFDATYITVGAISFENLRTPRPILQPMLRKSD